MRPSVTDTTPLNYLVLIHAVEMLPKLLERVLIPPSVKAELSDSQAPAAVRAWVAQPPAWVQVVAVRNASDPSLVHLDPGERDAIVLAEEQNAALLLMDERDGATTARSRGLQVVGTLGILDSAAARGWIDLAAMFDRLRETSFRSPSGLMASLLDQDAKRGGR